MSLHGLQGFLLANGIEIPSIQLAFHMEVLAEITETATEVPDPRLTGIPDKDDRSKNDRNSGTKDSGEGRKVGGGRWSPTGDTTKTQGDRVPYATSKGSNPDETIKEERRARSSQGRIDQEHEYGESDKVKNSDPGVEVDTPEKPEVPE
ncbi:hypothetical protein FB45DRAFT_878378 [Roridomyces roridus]|uniref:Uncharacterized protein n=1 Tax=Roridomyces roridus TaxID=1738132 RepID=A0AAD7B0F3_9AGAR|nr:hypothetical protein FB45DRAFT_878378 [Roridomyces roridus]